MRILVATDGSPFSRTTADYVARLSREVPLEIDLALVVDFHPIEYKMIADLYVDMIREGAKATAERILHGEAEYLRSLGVAVTERILYGDPASALCKEAAEGGFGLLVAGRRGHGDLQDVLFGSVSNQIIHRCATPTLILKKDAARARARGPVRVLVAAEPARGADWCVSHLAAFGAPKSLEVTLLGVVNPQAEALTDLPSELRYEALRRLHVGAGAGLDKALASLKEHGFTATRQVEEGRPGPTVCRVAGEGEYEIVVVGRRALGEIEEALFGSVSHHVLHHCPCHVLLVP